MTTYGVAYWGRCQETALADFAYLADLGVSWVNVPVSEERLSFDADGVSRILMEGKFAGLEMRVSPWGIGGIFGGEGIAGRKGPDAARWWLAKVQTLLPDAIYWDEPKGISGPQTVETLARETDLPQHCYVNLRVGTMPKQETLDRMVTVGTDAYDMPPDRALDEYGFFTRQTERPGHIWVKAHKLAPEDSDQPGRMIHALRGGGVPDIAIWGFPSPGCSVLDNALVFDVWQGIDAAIRGRGILTRIPVTPGY